MGRQDSLLAYVIITFGAVLNNRLMKHGLLLLLLVIASVTGKAQTNNETPEGIIENFFRIYDKEGVKAAVENIYSYGDSSMQQSLKYVQDTLAHTASNMGGKYLGHDLIVKKNASASLVMYCYLVKYRLAPLRLTFLFYKPQDKWEIMNFLFDSNTISELIKSGRNDLKN